MKEKLLAMVFSMMMERLSADVVKEWIDAGLDKLEDEIANDGKDDWKDMVGLPLIKLVRDAFSIPDND